MNRLFNSWEWHVYDYIWPWLMLAAGLYALRSWWMNERHRSQLMRVVYLIDGIAFTLLGMFGIFYIAASFP